MFTRALGVVAKGHVGLGIIAASFVTCASCNCELRRDEKVYDVAIVGGGIVGLAVARECAIRGCSVAVVEKNESLAAGVSAGNSGLGHTGYDAPPGTLERKLLRRSIRLHQNLYRSFGLSHEHVRKSGSLVVAWTNEQLEKLPRVLEENREAGDNEAQLIDAEELSQLEPSLSRDALGAVLCPYEAVVEPWLVPMGYAESARRHGVVFHLSSKVVQASLDKQKKIWDISIAPVLPDDPVNHSKGGEILVDAPPVLEYKPHSTNPNTVRAKVVINCAGLWGDDIEDLRLANNDLVKKKKNFTITPRKGQFLVFEPCKDQESPNYIIEPVATQFTKGVIVWTTVYGQIIVGPTAVNQYSKTDLSTDEATILALREKAEAILPGLKGAQLVGTYSGLRPATEHRDYQISAFPSENWISVSGIRSTGLSASSAIGEYIADLHQTFTDPEFIPAINHGMMGVSDSACQPVPSTSTHRSPPVPPLKTLALSLSEADNTVALYGKRAKVSHAISWFGMRSLS
mmetsp:Transcript_27287/g.43866  ORF Transcript_27287/g.43866 Transcript_27287/m.43866 type:complete len:515 (+) Transcript_27287:33-1577(+)